MKEIIIHVGPPKTGTSAIQKFLASNPKLLSELGILYPQHSLDKNGISSGNYNSIYSNTQKKVIDQQKTEALLNSFKHSEFSILLLSSEGFFDRMKEISEVWPEAKMIFYLRAPLDYMESTYNQSVKRQGNTEQFEVNSQKPDMSRLKILDNYIRTYGTNNLRLQYYHHQCFKNHNIISDFFSALNIADPRASAKELVNPSYSFEALQFKRHINRLKLPSYSQYLVDKVLQVHLGLTNYSLLTPERYKELRFQEIVELEKFFTKHPLNGFEDYLNALKNEQQKPFQKQVLTQEQWIDIASFIHKTSPTLYVYLSNLIKQNQAKLPSEAEIFWKSNIVTPPLRPIYRVIFASRKILNTIYLKLF